ncbi:MAG: M23 family metallopeptidase [Microbacterium sp.]|uniref:murein hydrolase activator EnvC family protein n=1 Tax=Microbacterium sp. TaxID=51671 RepID=UPI00263020D8|nr:M23 family metallopeptidase [Microbacterium sp.]MCX6502298.1 M23 family metallopeptidase [Microbacterium sp.]
MLRRALLTVLLVAAAGVLGPPAASGSVADGGVAAPRWAWPVPAARVVAPYVQPPHPYGAGHRGIDVRGDGVVVTAPADGVVAFAGRVVDRGVVTIDHGDGWVSSFEPVSSALTPGTAVVRGQEIGRISVGGHAPAGALHLGARHDGAYVNPLLLLGGVPRAVLLPCC